MGNTTRMKSLPKTQARNRETRCPECYEWLDYFDHAPWCSQRKLRQTRRELEAEREGEWQERVAGPALGMDDDDEGKE